MHRIRDRNGLDRKVYVGAGSPETRYARGGDFSIAYQVVGEGPTDLLLVPGWPSHVEHGWEQPRLAHFYRRMAAFSRLILFDKRGVGLSDRVAEANLPGIEQRMDDVRLVMDQVRSEQAALVGISDGGPVASVFAATYPERVTHLILVNSYARRLRSDDYPWGPTEEEWESFVETSLEQWGTPLFLEILFPTRVEEPGFAEWWATFLRQSSSPGAAAAYLRMNAGIDVREILRAIHVPTLVLHSAGDQICPFEGGRFLADAVPGARLVRLPGRDHQPWVTDAEPALAEIERFVTGGYRGAAPNTVLATLLFTDIVGSTELAARLGDRDWKALLDTHDSVIRTELNRFNGHELNTAGDGFLAMFDGPARAVRCALSIGDALHPLDVSIRSGVHTTEIELSGEDVRGLGIHIASRIMGLADAGEVVVSRVVRDLAVGSGLTFVERGLHTLKGVAGEWELFEVAGERAGVQFVAYVPPS
jgi:pimeloyl-ACP methyl ester carboxylesterase